MPSACRHRPACVGYAIWKRRGLIDGYVALLNARKLGLSLMAFIQIAMDKHTPERFGGFEAKVASFPEVLECHLITGQSADYLLKVIVEDMDAFQEFLLSKLTRIGGVSSVQSSICFEVAGADNCVAGLMDRFQSYIISSSNRSSSTGRP